MDIKKNDLVTMDITAMTSEGSGIGRAGSLAVFVPMTVPGDVIEAKIVKVLKNHAFGIIHQIIEASPSRMDPDCPYFKKCGGCVYRHIGYESECKVKETRVRDALERIGGFVDPPLLPIASAESRNHYRNKAQIPLGLDNEGKLIMGFYAHNSHRIIDAEHCLLQPGIFDIITDVFRRWFEEYGDTVYNEISHKGVLRHLYIRQGEGGVMVCVVINADTLKHADKLVKMLTLNVPEIKSIILNTNKEKTNVILGKKCRTIYGADFISDRLRGLEFSLSPLSFYQVNRDQAEKLYEKAAEYAALTGEENLLDLYCGTGTIGLSMAKKAKKLIGVEVIPQAVENARDNALKNGIQNAEFICGDAAKAAEVLKEQGEKPDVIIIDPPRKGCEASLIETISEMSPSRIVYVSCDPATLARDLKLFDEKGYKLMEAAPFDLFPATAHVECVVLMSRVKD